MADNNILERVAWEVKIDDEADVHGNTKEIHVDNGRKLKLMKDEIQFMKVFPEEIWILILDKVNDPNDLENLNNSSLYLRRLLLPKRVYFLFPKVWKNLMPKYKHFVDPFAFQNPSSGICYTGGGPKEAKNDVRFRKATEKWEYLPSFSVQTKLRLVCRDWNKVVENFYQSLPYHYKMKYDPVKWKESEKITDYTNIGTDIGHRVHQDFSLPCISLHANLFSRFEKTHGVGESSRNPFLGRSVRFGSRTKGWRLSESVWDQIGIPQVQRFRNQISNLLLSYGHHLWYCTLDIEDNFPTTVEYYAKLREWLELMPNLKVLEIRYTRQQKWKIDGGRRIEGSTYPSSEENIQLAAEVIVNPMPKLGNLKFLKTRYLPTPIFNELIRRNSHVTMLEIKREMELTNYDVYTFPMPNLEQLSMQIFTEKEFEMMERQQVNWPLNKFYLGFGRCEFIEWPRIFSLLENKLSSKLTHLALTLPKVERNLKNVVREYASLKLNLPQVKYFKVVIRNFSSLDFFTPMKDSLEILQITYGFAIEQVRKHQLVVDIEKEQTLKGLYDLDKLLNSNIWTLFQNLERLDVAVKWHNRKHGIRPFPSDRDYLESFWRSEWKSGQMYVEDVGNGTVGRAGQEYVMYGAMRRRLALNPDVHWLPSSIITNGVINGFHGMPPPIRPNGVYAGVDGMPPQIRPNGAHAGALNILQQILAVRQIGGDAAIHPPIRHAANDDEANGMPPPIIPQLQADIGILPPPLGRPNEGSEPRND